MKQEKKPCPFCCEDRWIDIHRDESEKLEHEWYVSCGICNSFGPPADSVEKAIKKWNERKYSPKHHQELEKIAKRLGEMNRPEHDEIFGDEFHYDEEPSYWEVTKIVLHILDEYDSDVKKVPIGIAKLVEGMTKLLNEFDDEWESWDLENG